MCFLEKIQIIWSSTAQLIEVYYNQPLNELNCKIVKYIKHIIMYQYSNNPLSISHQLDFITNSPTLQSVDYYGNGHATCDIVAFLGSSKHRTQGGDVEAGLLKLIMIHDLVLHVVCCLTKPQNPISLTRARSV